MLSKSKQYLTQHTLHAYYLVPNINYWSRSVTLCNIKLCHMKIYTPWGPVTRLVAELSYLAFSCSPHKKETIPRMGKRSERWGLRPVDTWHPPGINQKLYFLKSKIVKIKLETCDWFHPLLSLAELFSFAFRDQQMHYCYLLSSCLVAKRVWIFPLKQTSCKWKWILKAATPRGLLEKGIMKT